MSNSSLQRITIVGLGLIGGSLAGACQRKFPHARIVGVTRSRTALAKAKKKKWIHEGYTDLKQAFSNRRATRRVAPTIVILCTPVDTLKIFLKRLDRLAPPGTVVSDAGSVKGFLVRWADREPWHHIRFVGAHPMAGSHERGIAHAQLRLFDHALTFVTPGRNSSKAALRFVRDFWRKISHRVVVISPEKHDRFTAEVSHLPHLLAALMVTTVSPRALRFASTGFLDATRVAQGDPSLWVPIMDENKKEIARALRRFEAHLKVLKGMLKKGDLTRLRRTLRHSQKRRKKCFYL